MHQHTPSSGPLTPEQLLRAHDLQVRGSIAARLPGGWTAYPDGRVLRVRTGHRGFAFTDSLHDLNAEQIEDAVVRTVAFFDRESEAFEWKTYSHDHPLLIAALERHGFTPEPTETILIGETSLFTDVGSAPEDVELRCTTDRHDLERIASLQTEVWNEDWAWLADDLADRIRFNPDDIAIWIAEAADQAVSTAWLVRLPGTQFAGLWGGSTLKAWRHRGIYRALVAARAQAAEQLGVRYLWVDASDDSRPILERLGMNAVATTTPWIKEAPAQD